MDADGPGDPRRIPRGWRPRQSILMDVEAYEHWERFGTDLDPKGRPLTSRDPRPVPRLTAGERALYGRLIAPAWTGPRRVEQERIPLHVALGHRPAADASLITRRRPSVPM
jgi:Wadjet protein JetD, C-terminal